MLILFVLATSSIAKDIKRDANRKGGVSGAVNSVLATLTIAGAIVNNNEDIRKDTIYINYSASNVSFIGAELADVQITHDQADVQVVIGENPNIVLCLSGKSDDGRISIKADTLFTLMLAGIELTSLHAPAINSYGKQKVNVELVDGTKNHLQDSKTYILNQDEEGAKGCFSVQGALSFTGNGELTLRGRSKHAIYAKKSVIFLSGTYNVLEAASDAIHTGESVTIEGGDLKLNGMKSEAIELDNDFTMSGGTIEMIITGAGAKGIRCGGDLTILGGAIQATASGDMKNKDGNLSCCSIIKCDGSTTITNGEFHLTNSSPCGKCIECSRNMYLGGGTLSLITSGQGKLYLNKKGGTSICTPKCIDCNDTLLIKSASISCLCTGISGKGIVSKYCVIGDGSDSPKINVETKGDALKNDIIFDERDGCPKAVKIKNTLKIHSADIHIVTSGTGGEGIECCGEMYVYGGSINCKTYDDGINVGKKLNIHNGNIYCYSYNNDGIDSNGKMGIYGGTVISISTHEWDEAFDVDRGLLICGGEVLGVGRDRCKLSQESVAVYNTEGQFSKEHNSYLTDVCLQGNDCLILAEGKKKHIASVYIPQNIDNAFLTLYSSKLRSNRTYYLYEGGSPISYDNGFSQDEFTLKRNWRKMYKLLTKIQF